MESKWVGRRGVGHTGVDLATAEVEAVDIVLSQEGRGGWERRG